MDTILDGPTDEHTVQDNPSPEYPSLVRRFKAVLIDAVIVMTALIIIMQLVQDSSIRSTIMVTTGLIIILGYEPLLTAYSRTIGQRIMKLRVGKIEDPSHKISLIRTYMRWLTKAALGWLSFVTVHFNPERRAIHDIISGSVMIVEE